MTTGGAPTTGKTKLPLQAAARADRGLPRCDGYGWDARFEACFRHNYGRVLAYVLRRTGDRTVAEDVAAETFLVAWRRRELLPDDALPWLLATARNLVLNQHRSRRRRDRVTLRLPTSSAARPPRSPSDSTGPANGWPVP
jgi:DNA-directed RNA polymerase specialized sigma24 family protein